MQPLASVIIPTYNRCRYVCEAIDSVLAQTYPHLEVFVIDDGSMDDTPQAMKKYGEKIKYLRQEQLGVCVARNSAIRQAKGQYISFLDDDDVWLPQKIEKDVEFLEKNKDCGFVFCGFYYFSDVNENMGKRVLTEYEETTYDCLYNKNLIYSTSLVTMRRECLEKEGLFDENLIQSADYDLWLRVAKHCKFGAINECLAKYRLHETNMSKNLKCRIKVYKQIFDKPEIREGKNWLQRMIRMARMHHYAASFFCRYCRYLDASKHYALAVFYFPFVGYYHWPLEVEGIRFTFVYRILKVYVMIFYCLFKALTFPKENIPSTTLVDV